MPRARSRLASEEPTSAPSTEDHEQESRRASAERAPGVLRVPTAPRQRNRVLGLLLASLALTVFVTVFTLVILFHYAEAHHLLAKL